LRGIRLDIKLLVASALDRTQKESRGDLAKLFERATALGIHLTLRKTKRTSGCGRLEVLCAKKSIESSGSVRDESFSHLIVGFHKEDKLRYLTEVAREENEAKRMEYKTIGNLKKARVISRSDGTRPEIPRDVYD
jgi:homospermidine synthase